MREISNTRPVHPRRPLQEHHDRQQLQRRDAGGEMMPAFSAPVIMPKKAAELKPSRLEGDNVLSTKLTYNLTEADIHIVTTFCV